MLDSGTDLVVNNLLRRTTFVEETVKLDDIRVLVFSARQHGRNMKNLTDD